MGTAARSGKMLAAVANGSFTAPDDRIYMTLVKGDPSFPDPSELAQSHEAQDRLWRESARMVGTD